MNHKSSEKEFQTTNPGESDDSAVEKLARETGSSREDVEAILDNEQLREARQAAVVQWLDSTDKSDKEIADALGKGKQYISGFRTGYMRLSLEFAEQLATHAGVDKMQFLIQLNDSERRKLRLDSGTTRLSEVQVTSAQAKILNEDMGEYTASDLVDMLKQAQVELDEEQEADWAMAIANCRNDKAILPEEIGSALKAKLGLNELPLLSEQSAPRAKKKSTKRKKSVRAADTSDPAEGIEESDVVVLGELELTPKKLHELFGGKVQIVQNGKRYEYRAVARARTEDLFEQLSKGRTKADLIALLLKKPK